MTKPVAVAIAAGFVALLGVQPARAAHFVVQSQQTNKSANPPDLESRPPALNCPGMGAASFFANLAPDGHSATFSGDASIALGPTAPGCPPQNVSITATISAVVLIAPDAGESEGDPLTVCAQLNDAESAAASANYSALAGFGDTTFTGPAFITLIPAGPSITLLSDGPRIVTDGQDGNSQRRQYTVQIGDQISMGMGLEVGAKGVPPGFANASVNGLVQYSMGACSAPVPVASPRGIGLLIGVLAGVGLLGVWRLGRQGGRDTV